MERPLGVVFVDSVSSGVPQLVNHCPSCVGVELKALSPWLSVCPHCDLYLSKLAPGPGKAFDGLETLRRQNFETTLDVIERIRPLRGQRLLEIGSSKGWFLEAAQKRGAIVSGVEPVPSDAAIARASGFQIEEGLFPEYPSDKGPYDIIAFNDVFEHLPDPAKAVIDIEQRLAENGLLSINIPSSDGLFFKTAKALAAVGFEKPYDRMWQRGLPSPHMSYFSPENLKQLIERSSGLRRWPGEPISLPSISTAGLRERIEGQSVGLPTWIVYPAMLALSTVAGILPSDIHLAVFTKGKSHAE